MLLGARYLVGSGFYLESGLRVQHVFDTDLKSPSHEQTVDVGYTPISLTAGVGFEL